MDKGVRVDTWEYFSRLSSLQVGPMGWISVDASDPTDVISVNIRLEPDKVILADEKSRGSYNMDFFDLKSDLIENRAMEAVDRIVLNHRIVGGTKVALRTLYGA